MPSRLVLWVLFLWFPCLVCHAEPLADGDFVRVSGTGFLVGPKGAERPFVFVGANFNPIHGEAVRAAYKEQIAALRHDGMTVGRVWALGEGPADASEWLRKNDLFRAGPDGYIEETYVMLDRVLAEAREQGLRLIITLSNHWKDYGGIPQYLRWSGIEPDGLAFERFYDNEQVKTNFRKGVEKLLLRVNTVTGVRYIDDPVIFSWELMNESNVLTKTGAKARLSWIREMAGFIRSHDKNHLITPGLLGYEMVAERSEWVRACQLPEVDYCDCHLYPQGQGQVQSTARLYDFLDDRSQLGRFVIKKPLVFGEFGFRTDGSPAWLGIPRAQWFGRFVDRVLGNGAAGVLVWIYEPFSGKPRDYGIYTDRRDTDDVRAALRLRAERAQKGHVVVSNQRLSPAVGDKLLYEPLIRVSGSAKIHGEWKKEGTWSLLGISPDQFSEARFERAGSWAGGAILHVYGANIGHFSYRFSSPPKGRLPKEVVIEARLSSEWPGAAAPADGGSLVQVLIDDHLVSTLRVLPDNGVGKLEQVRIRDPKILGLLRNGIHRLVFRVSDGPSAHGLCIYGSATGKEAAPKETLTPMHIFYR